MASLTLGFSDYPALDDSPFRQYCIKNANVWKLYMDLAKEFDKNLAELFNRGLFSAILSAFLIEIRKGLQEDLQSVTNNLLTVLIQSQHNSTAAEIPPSSTFVPTLSSRWVNGLWFTSLVFSLISALGASVAKGWVTQFSSNVSGSSWSDVSLHCERLRDLERWRLTMIIECLPILIHIVFFLFAAGLVVLLFNDDLPIAIVVLVLTAVVGAAYIGNSIVSAYYLNSPLRTPGVRSFPSEEGSQKAQALLWLLAQSTDGLTVNATVRALAGLPTAASAMGVGSWPLMGIGLTLAMAFAMAEHISLCSSHVYD
ncbi:hypothetical protein B0H14DRAFT_3155388 [Mycena olivaceomarginata]|nr:hypothetical protein B0H14DRAFT_3155388 [Mycena olivaceomarginata]